MKNNLLCLFTFLITVSFAHGISEDLINEFCNKVEKVFNSKNVSELKDFYYEYNDASSKKIYHHNRYIDDFQNARFFVEFRKALYSESANESSMELSEPLIVGSLWVYFLDSIERNSLGIAKRKMLYTVLPCATYFGRLYLFPIEIGIDSMNPILNHNCLPVLEVNYIYDEKVERQIPDDHVFLVRENKVYLSCMYGESSKFTFTGVLGILNASKTQMRKKGIRGMQLIEHAHDDYKRTIHLGSIDFYSENTSKISYLFDVCSD